MAFRITVGYQPEHEPRWWTGVIYLTRESAKAAAFRWLLTHPAEADNRAYTEVEPVQRDIRVADGLFDPVRQLPIYGRERARRGVIVPVGVNL